jgi:hypothetical protein
MCRCSARDAMRSIVPFKATDWAASERALTVAEGVGGIERGIDAKHEGAARRDVRFGAVGLPDDPSNSLTRDSGQSL